MAHVHYDTDTIIKSMEDAFNAVSYGENDPYEFKATHRHRQITLEFARMAFDEANRGSDPDFIIWISAHFCVEFITNFANMAECDLHEVAQEFVSHFLSCLRQESDGTADVAAEINYSQSEGGHA